VKPLRVALPLGIGDALWSCMKLRALSEYHGGAPVEAHINASPNHATVGYLEIVPFIAKAVQSKAAPNDIWRQLPPNHRYPRWSTLKGSAGWEGFDYVLVANGHLERGEHISTYLPELNAALGRDATDYCYEHAIKPRDAAYARSFADDVAAAGSPVVLLYASGVGPNHGFHNGTWRVEDWAATARLLMAEGIRPLLVGANTTDDLGQRDLIARHMGDDFAGVEDTVGRTNIPQYVWLIERAAVWIGLNSGGGIVSAMRGTPTVMFWSDSAHPIYGVDPRNMLHTDMKTGFLAPWQLEPYRTLSFGSPELTPRNAVARALEVMRR
jgi:hypothetical protein